MPLYDKILVRREKPKETYDAAGMVAVAETHQQAQNRGTVIAVGPGRLNPNYGTTIPLTVHVGMEVLFGKHSGTDMEDAPDLVLLREDELLAYRMPSRD
jgi:co-chaperonin GroES (HSP10)